MDDGNGTNIFRDIPTLNKPLQLGDSDDRLVLCYLLIACVLEIMQALLVHSSCRHVYTAFLTYEAGESGDMMEFSLIFCDFYYHEVWIKA